MAYTFGGATGDDVTATLSQSNGASARVNLIRGWWYPTTLTATRVLMSHGAVLRVAIDTTTSELRITTDNTTDGEWTTTGVGLTVDTWTFIAIIGSWNTTGPAVGLRVWAGTAETPPAEVTVTNVTAPVGAFVGSTGFSIGNNAAAGTLAFQGDIDWVAEMCVNSANFGASHPFAIATNGVITQAEADHILRTHVMPAWATGHPYIVPVGQRIHEQAIWNGNALAHYQCSRDDATFFAIQTPTYAGATLSARRGPRPMPAANATMPRRFRR